MPQRKYTMPSALLAALAATLCLAAATGARPAPRPGSNASGKPAYAAGQAQQQPRQRPPKGGVIRSETNLVELFATVRDRHSAIVPDLTKDDFRIYEDGRQQKIAYFAKDVNEPITLGLLIDTSGSQEGLLGAEQDSASQFLRQVMRKNDLAMVISFDTDVNLLADFTDNQSLLQSAIQKARINAPFVAANPGPFPQQINQTSTAFYDAIYLACRNQLADQAGRKALVILTDAQDEGSKMTLRDAIDAAQRANAVVHILLIANPGSYFSAGQFYNGAGVAKKVAQATGGRVIDIRRGRDFDKAFQQISEELRSQYVLGYYPTNSAHDGTFRKIKVETTRPGLHVLTRQGYYAPEN